MSILIMSFHFYPCPLSLHLPVDPLNLTVDISPHKCPFADVGRICLLYLVFVLEVDRLSVSSFPDVGNLTT